LAKEIIDDLILSPFEKKYYSVNKWDTLIQRIKKPDSQQAEMSTMT
jgi:hypothetical protein